MYQLNHIDDTIVAVSTPLGQGGVGIVRLSGKKTLMLCDELFISRNKKKPSQFKSFTVHYGWVVKVSQNKDADAGPFASSVKDPDAKGPSVANRKIIDEVLLTVMRAPKSYTKEDVAEISCHGGAVVLKMILQLAVDLGARLAEPGEFTKRAFLNGRIDLAQAEAVLDIIGAKTDRSLQMSLNQLRGELSTELGAIREYLMGIYIQLEAIVNFPEDEVDVSNRAKLIEQLQSAQKKVDRLLVSSEHGRILKEGIKVVICGKPNVGKSSLLNVLLKVPRAIVTDVAGTTRDTIEETAQIKGIPFQLIDTAGILPPRDLVEEEAIKRSHLSIQNADLILFVLDGSSELSSQDESMISIVHNRNVLVIINKIDLSLNISDEKIRHYFGDKKVVKVSVLKKTGIEELENALLHCIWQGKPGFADSVLVSNVRHIQALNDCVSTLDRAESIMQDGLSFEFVSEEIKLAINFLDSITGHNIDSDLLDKIFSEFCIGK